MLNSNETHPIHIYEIGDLDDFFWADTVWYALKEGTRIQQVVLIYYGISPTALLGFTAYNTAALTELLLSIADDLPNRIYVHLNENITAALSKRYHIQYCGRYYKMALADFSQLENISATEVIPLTPDDQTELEILYQESYPGNWFNPRMLETGYYFGIRRHGKIICAAGVHVYSPTYGVAALGNITTHPDYRGQGLGTRVTARLCQNLKRSVKHIGLNVRADNKPAISSYKKLGFEIISAYEENMLAARSDMDG